MDAQVAALQANFATLQTEVGLVLAAYQALQTTLAGVDPADEAALAAVNAQFVTLNGTLAAALAPAATGPTGVSGATGPSPSGATGP